MKPGASNETGRLSSEKSWLSGISSVLTCAEYKPSYGLVSSTTHASSPAILQSSAEKSPVSKPSKKLGVEALDGGIEGASEGVEVVTEDVGAYVGCGSVGAGVTTTELDVALGVGVVW